MSEADLHARHASKRKTLEWFEYSDDLKATVEMLNVSNGFKPYTIPRTPSQTGLVDDSPVIEDLKTQMSIPPVRLSPAEKRVAELAAVGATVTESAAALDLSEAAIKTHRQSIASKTFAPNLASSMVKLIVHGILTTKEVTQD